MIRILILRMILVAVPFALYALWRWVQRLRGQHDQRIWEQAPTLWLLTAGLALAALSLIIPALFIPASPR